LKKGELTPEEIVELKRACGAPVSYKFLQKRLEWFAFYQTLRVCEGTVSEPRRGELRGANIPPTMVQGTTTATWPNRAGMDSSGQMGSGQALGGFGPFKGAGNLFDLTIMAAF
jgi:hypothetical protein